MNRFEVTLKVKGMKFHVQTNQLEEDVGGQREVDEQESTSKVIMYVEKASRTRNKKS